ncbi:MAG: glycosyl hydrolase family 28 protein [Nibricoccus sp.]
MSVPTPLRCSLFFAFLLALFLNTMARGETTPSTRVSILAFKAVADGQTINTVAIQAAIDQVAAQGGGTVVVPEGVFVSGALFLKPKVNLHLEKGAVLQCSTDMKNFPEQRTRIEGHIEEHFNPALINANGCDGLQITGEGTLDGAGRPIWDLFWKLRGEAPNRRDFRNVSVPRARLALIENSKNVVIDGITFKDSQFWNLHLYRCQSVRVQNARFQVPDDYKHAPSTDGIDIDSSQNITINGCSFSVTDDCIAAKGSKGPFAQEDKDSPAVEGVHVSNCTFKRGGAVISLGSEASTVRNVLVENCEVSGTMPVLNCKLRPDTPQTYENIELKNLTLDSADGTLLRIAPWLQYFDLKGQPRPKSTVRAITIANIKGRTGTLAFIKPNAGQTMISDITLRDINLDVRETKSEIADSVENLRFEHVVLNGKPALQPLPPATLSNVAYGSHPRQVLDFWQAASDKPTPLVFYIHGGGWVHGDKQDPGLRHIRKYLAAGISVVSINYRYTSMAQAEGVKPPVEWPMHDAARALQFVRSKAAEWNIDKQRIGVSGGSAVACTSLWLAFHADLADASSKDPVSRESTRPFCAAVHVPQTSLDPLQMKEWTPNSRYGGHAFGFSYPEDTAKRESSFATFLAHRDEVLPWIKEYSPYEQATADASPVYMIFDAPPGLGQPQKDPTHTSNFGVKLKEKLDALHVECELVYPGEPDVKHAGMEEYLIDMLKSRAVAKPAN